jgi:hypothetical protein
LSVTDFVRCYEGEHVSKNRIFTLFSEPAEEIVREVLREHELDEPLYDLGFTDVDVRLRTPNVDQLLIRNPRLILDRFQVGTKRMEMLEAFVQLERKDNARIDVIPHYLEQPREIHGVVGLDQRCITECGENLGTPVRRGPIDVTPVNVPFH